MTMDRQHVADRWARRGVYFLVMGVGAFLVYFNEVHGWVQAPEYPRLGDVLFDRIEPYLQPHLPNLTLVLGGVFLLASGFSFYRFVKADAADGSAP